MSNYSNHSKSDLLKIKAGVDEELRKRNEKSPEVCRKLDEFYDEAQEISSEIGKVDIRKKINTITCVDICLYVDEGYLVPDYEIGDPEIADEDELVKQIPAYKKATQKINNKSKKFVDKLVKFCKVNDLDFSETFRDVGHGIPTEFDD